MKYLLSFLLLVSFSLTSHHAYASFIAGALEPTQLLNLAELIPTDISTSATALNTQLLEYKATILDPLGDVLIAVAQLQTSNGIINLVNGGSKGNSLIIGDPRSYADQKGLSAVKIGLGAIASQKGGAYNNTLLSSLTNNFKSVSITTKLQNINQSAIPSIVQKNACDDTMLSDLAKQDVAVEGQPLDQAAYTARKQYFYDQFCKGSASDPKTAAALKQLQAARPNIGGWDSWLALTGGDNAYTKVVQTNEGVAEEVQARKDAANKDLANGRGVVSQKQCLVRAPTDANGEAYSNPESAPCISDVVLNPSGLLQDSLTKASNAGLDRLGNVQGWGALVDALTKITGLVNGVRSSKGVTVTVNSSTSNTASAPKNDLINDPNTKATLLDPIVKVLDLDTKNITDLQDVDQKLLVEVTAYKAKFDAAAECYGNAHPVVQDWDPATVALIQNRSGIINGLLNKISDDTKKTNTAKQMIQTTRDKLTAAKSTQEIFDAFFAYQKASGAMPSLATLAERKTDYALSKSNAAADTGPNGEVTKLAQWCRVAA